MSRPTVLVVSDHPIVFDRIRTMLEPEFDAMSLVAHPESVVAAVGALEPTILVVDLSTATVRGSHVVARVREELPEQRCITLVDRGLLEGLEQEARLGRVDTIVDLPHKIRELLHGGDARPTGLAADAERWAHDHARSQPSLESC